MRKITPLLFAVFACSILHAASFTAVVSGNWNSTVTWGSVSLPTQNDDVTIPAGITVTVPSSYTALGRNITTVAGAPGGKIKLNWALLVYGNLTNAGTITGTNSNIFFYTSNKTITSSGAWSVAGTSGLLFYGSRTITPGSIITCTNICTIEAGVTVTNNGSLICNDNLVGGSGTSTLVNGATGTLTVRKVVLSTGRLNASTAGNTVIYEQTAGTQNIKLPLTTYANLTIRGAGTRTLVGATTITGDFTWTGTTAFNMANFAFSVGGNWTNTANLTASNMATVTMTGTGTITRAATEIFNNLTINSAGTVTLGTAIQTNGTLTLTAGTLDVSAGNFGITCRSNWTNNGGTFTGQSGTVTFNNTNHTIGGTTSTTFSNIAISNSGTLTLGVNTNVSQNFNYNTGTINCATFNWTVGGNWNNTANTDLTNMGTVTFNGAGAQTITRTATEMFNVLTISSTGTVSPAVGIQTSGNMNITSGTFDVTASNFPVVVNGSFNLSGGTYNAQGGSLAVKGNFTHSAGTFTAGTGNVIFSGVAAQTIGGAALTQFHDMTLSNAAGVSLTSAKQLLSNGTMTLAVGNFNTGGFDFTLLSSAGSTGRIATVPVGSSLLGATYVVQRFIPGPATAYWDYLCSPVSGTTFKRWDDVVAPTPFYMSGIGGNDGNSCCPIFRSVRRFNEPTNAYVNITSVGTAITRGTGYMVWVASNLGSLSSSLLFDSKGSVVSTDQSIGVTKGAGSGYNLIGNPMPSAILWSSVFAASSNLSNQFLILDQTLQNYATWNGATSTGTGLLAGSGGVINSTQGFMVVATAAAGTVGIPESAKTGLTSAFVRTMDATNVIKVKLSNDFDRTGAEDMLSFMPDGNNATDDVDLPFLPSPFAKSSSLKIIGADGKELMGSCVNAYSESHEIPLKVMGPMPGNYTLSFSGIDNIGNYNCVYLEDLQTGKVYNLKGNNSYTFHISDPGVEHQFILHLENERLLANGNFACRYEMGGNSSLDESMNVFADQNGFNLDFNFSTATRVTISVYNALGELVVAPKVQEVSDELVTIGADLSSGLYVIRVETGSEILNRKLFHN